jgi:hypothetical protein
LPGKMECLTCEYLTLSSFSAVIWSMVSKMENYDNQKTCVVQGLGLWVISDELQRCGTPPWELPFLRGWWEDRTSDHAVVLGLIPTYHQIPSQHATGICPIWSRLLPSFKR